MTIEDKIINLEEDTILVGLLHSDTTLTPKEISKIYNIPLEIVREIIRRDEESN
tara:strand:+ start:90 stop:251 length:162 start_codon:yes stop_codon:yes gene_type:complete